MQKGKISRGSYAKGKNFKRVLCKREKFQEGPMQKGKISIFATLGGHLGFLRKIKKCEYLENRKR